MYVFVTGATGYIGHAVVGELAALGHAVTGLVRSDAKAELVRRLGAKAVVGDIADPATYHDHAAEHEALVHVAFGSDAGAVAAGPQAPFAARKRLQRPGLYAARPGSCL